MAEELEKEELLTISAKVKKSLKTRLELEAVLRGHNSLNTLLGYIIERRNIIYGVASISPKNTGQMPIVLSLSEDECNQLYRSAHEQELSFEQFCHQRFMQGIYDYGFTNDMPPHPHSELGKPIVDQRFTGVNPSVNPFVNSVNSVNLPTHERVSQAYQTEKIRSSELSQEEVQLQLEQARLETIYYKSLYEKQSAISENQSTNSHLLETTLVSFDKLLGRLEYVFELAAELANEPHIFPRNYSPEYFSKLLENEGSSSN